MLESLKRRIGGAAPVSASAVGVGAERSRRDVRLARLFFSLEDRVALYHELVALMEAGVPYQAAMTKYRGGLADVLSDGDHRVIFLDTILHHVTQGSTIAQAIDGWVSESERGLIESGERGGDLVTAFKNAGRAALAARQIRQTMWGAISEPLMDFVILIATMVYVSVWFVPQMTFGQNPARDWTGTAWWLWATSWFIASWGWLVAALAGVGCYLALASLSGAPIRLPGTERVLVGGFIGRLRDRADQYVPWSLYRDMAAADALLSFGVLLSTGVPLVESLMRLQRWASPYVREKLRRTVVGMGQGQSDQEVWNVGLVSPERAVSIAILSKTPRFKEAVVEMGEKLVGDTQRSIEARMKRVALVVRLTVTAYTAFLFIALSAVGDMTTQMVTH